MQSKNTFNQILTTGCFILLTIYVISGLFIAFIYFSYQDDVQKFVKDIETKNAVKNNVGDEKKIVEENIDTSTRPFENEPNQTNSRIYVPSEKTQKAAYYYEQGFEEWSLRKDWIKAKEFYDKSLEEDPNYPPALSSRGYIKGAFENDFEGGKKMIEKSMELDPTWVYAPFNLGILYGLNGDSVKGKYWIQYAIDLDPEHPDADYFRNFLKEIERYEGGNN